MRGFRNSMVVLITCCLVSAEKWNAFKRVSTFEGHVCQEPDIAFVTENLKDKTRCLLHCTFNPNCRSIFYVKSTRTCVGCSLSYNVTNTPTGTAEGSVYYEYEKCPTGWFNIKNSCYTLTGPMNFDDGVNKCQSLDAHPVTIETVEEITSLKLELSLIPLEELLIAFIAYTDAAVEGIWTVVGSSELMTVTDWGLAEPNGGTLENCIAILGHLNYQWVDITCQATLQMVCEKELLN